MMSMLEKSKSSLSLQDIRELGGTKDDLLLLEGVDSESASELEFNQESMEGDEQEGAVVTTNEIQSVIQSLGLYNAKGGQDTSSVPMQGSVMIKGDKETSVVQGDKPLLKTDKKKRKKQKDSEVAAKAVSSASGVPQIDERVSDRLLHISVKSYKKLLVSMDDEKMWYEQARSSDPAFPVTASVIEHLLRVGEGLMKNELRTYEQVRQKRKGASEVRWLKTVLSSGTLSDKMAALILLVQESPVHTLSSLDSLLSMAAKKGKRECVLAVDTLKELWITDLLPEGRKLKTLKQRPLNHLVPSGNRSLQQCHHTLLLWHYEHQLKNRYAQYLTILKGLSHDTVANVREKMVGHIFDLLYQRPEQEQELLSQLVNKIGDPVKKIASKVILFLLKLLSHHVNMKVIVAMAIERLLHRPNIGQKAQYYAICCLNQFTIDHEDEALAAKLIELFFTFFKLYVKKGQLDAKMLGALLTGVNRAFPFMKGDIPSFEEHLHSLFTVVHVGPLATGIQSLMLLFQVMESRSSVSGRYYQALYSKLMDPALKHSGKQAMFLNLLFKSVKSDPEINRVKAFLKRILQICSAHAPPFICGCLFLISEIVKHKPSLWSFILQSERSDEEHFTDVDTTRLPSFEGTQSPDDKESHVTVPDGHVTKGVGYHVAHRNPLYSGAEHTCLWELSQLTRHYHPSVQVFAKKIACGEHIDYRGDPLADFTLMRFLDRFICKNPKQKQSDHGGSIMQRTIRMAADPSKEILANSSQFASMDESKVKVEELFMYRYFTQKAAGESKKKKKKEKEKEKERGGDMEMDRFSDSDSDMDFAGELERQAKSKRQLSKKARRKMEGSSDEESGGDVESVGGEMSGSDLDFGAFVSDDDSLVGAGGGEGDTEPTDAEMERLLLDNLSSGSELDESEEEKGPPRKKRKNRESRGKFDTSSLFAAADEFAHLLEDSSGYGGQHNVRRKDKASEKQLQWEERRAVTSRRPAKQNRKKKGHQSENKSSSGGKNSRRLQSKTGVKRTGKRRNFSNRQERGRAKSGRANRNARRK